MPVRTDHRELLIVKGVAAAKGDTASGEVGLQSISLLAEPNQSGWSLNADGGWSPKFTQLKGGGTWADSAVGPGRTLVAGEDANVVETLQLTVTGTTILDLAGHFTRMGRLRQALYDFWTAPNEMDPLYLHWWAKGAPGPQFALIYALDVAEDEPDVWSNPIRDVTITIEREPYWRGLPPGANPKVWNHEQIRKVTTYTAADLNLYANSVGGDVNHALAATVTNNDRSPSDNYVELIASKIPGDAPALLQLSIAIPATVSPSTFHVAVREEPFAYSNISSTFISTLDASAATLGTDAASAADATVASGNRVNITPGTTADSLRVTFSTSLPAYQGRFAVFLRAYQNGGSAGDWLAHVEVNAATLFTAGIPTLVLPEKQFAVGATQWPMVYMGEIELPVGVPSVVGSLGTGLQQTNFSILVYARRTTGTSTLRFADLVLLPLDNGYAKFTANVDTTKSNDLLIDNTGYLAHGKPGDYAVPLVSGVGNQAGLIEYAGPSLYLTPGKTNRIYFIRDDASASPIATFKVRGNIIPRWRGIRDV